MWCHGTHVVVIKIPEGKEIAMSTHGVISNDAPGSGSATNVNVKLEVVLIPVSSVNRAKEFYSRLGWWLDLGLNSSRTQPLNIGRVAAFGASGNHRNSCFRNSLVRPLAR